VYNLVGVSDRHWLVEALAERIAHEGARCHVKAAHAYVNVTDDLPIVGMGMHRYRTPDVAHLYGSSSITVKYLAFLTMRLASV
jgi:hypothetical protein